MAKQTGLGQGFLIGGYSIPGDVQSVAARGGPAVLDVTGIDKSAFERIGGLYDGSLDVVTFFNDDALRSFPALKTLPTTDTGVMYVEANALDGEAYCLVAKQLNYDGTRGADGSLTFEVATVASAGTGGEWCKMLTAGLRTDTTATNGTGIDGTASTSTGWAAYLQVTAFAGTSVTVTIQDSADNVTWTPALTGGAFAAATALGTQRIEGASGATLRRYVRAITTGTFSSATFAVAVTRFPTGAQ